LKSSANFFDERDDLTFPLVIH